MFKHCYWASTIISSRHHDFVTLSQLISLAMNNMNFEHFLVKVKSHGLRLISSSNRRHPAKLNRQAATKLKSDKEPELLVSFTMASSISNVIDSFFTNGLMSDRWSPFNVALTNVWDDGEVKPAVAWTHAKAWQISSTADFDPVSSAKCCKYGATLCGFAGMGTSLCDVAQTFHRLKAPKHFMVVLFAQLWRIVEGRLLDNSFNSGSSIPLSSIQIPWESTLARQSKSACYTYNDG